MLNKAAKGDSHRNDNHDENVASEPTAKSDQAHAPLRSACTTGPKPTLRQNTVAVFLTRTIQEKIKLDQI